MTRRWDAEMDNLFPVRPKDPTLKIVARGTGLEIRKQLRDTESKSRAIVDILSESGRLGKGLLALFAPRPGEVNVLPLFEKFPAAFPKVFPGNTLGFFRVTNLATLQKGKFGIREPATDPDTKVTAWGPGDVVLVPGLLFDSHGGRIGSGLGYYDRFLANNQAFKIGVCFSEQLSPSVLPQDATDVPMDAVLTETGWALGPV